MARALLSRVAGGVESLSLEEIADPVPGADEVVVAVRCVGVNYPDLLIIEDRYQIKPARPFAPGAEFAGIVEAVGSGVTDLAVGDRVLAVPLFGGMAERAVVAANACHKVPNAVSFEAAAAMALTYATAYHALKDRAGLRASENLLVLGAGGGVGLAAVELGRALGAKVVAAASSEAKLAAARDKGALDGIVYPKGDLDKAALKTLGGAFKTAFSGEGPDIVFDTVGGAYTEPALRALNWEGRLLIVGFPAGIAEIPMNLPLLKGCDIRGVFWGAAVKRDPDTARTDMADLLARLKQGEIAPRIHARFDLERGGEAIAALAGRDVIGKIVVTIGGEE